MSGIRIKTLSVLSLFPYIIHSFVTGPPVTSDDPIPQDSWYPYMMWHDDRRPNHQYWGLKVDKAICIHKYPGLRNPSTLYNNTYLGADCTRLVKQEIKTESAARTCAGAKDLSHKLADGTVLNMEESHGELVGYFAEKDWHTHEHCRAGCETCFDAMAEFGAEQAICRRMKKWAHCGMGFQLKPPLPFHCDGVLAWSEYDGFGTRGYAACDDAHIKFAHPFHQELGYENKTRMIEAAEKGDVRVYYTQGYMEADDERLLNENSPHARRKMMELILDNQ
ncbi:MAG: hypothetical protein LQ340_006414 [Diploschistes diacapsis]|nr:MAG: hypothetical protein LQ340_006414 [Diploschistes diacapsis]